MSIIQGPFSVAPCQTLRSMRNSNITIRNFFIAVHLAVRLTAPLPQRLLHGGRGSALRQLLAAEHHAAHLVVGFQQGT
jgi:hypothetical protein